jgi:hypothetical protein
MLVCARSFSNWLQDLNSPMKAFGRSCSFVSGSDLAATTVPGGTNVASGAVFPSLSEPPQRTQTLGKHFSCDLFCSFGYYYKFHAADNKSLNVCIFLAGLCLS